MGRAKQRMELIRNGKSRYVTFQKRKKGMKKKAYELQTLCDVEVCLIVYGPTTDEHHNDPLEAEIWPENPDTIHHLLDSYKNQPPEERVKKTQTLSNFFIDRNQKIEDSLVKLRKKNDEATYSTWDDRYSNWSMEQLRGFEVTLEGKLASRCEGKNCADEGYFFSHSKPSSVLSTRHVRNEENAMGGAT